MIRYLSCLVLLIASLPAVGADEKSSALALAEKLNRRVNFTGFDDPKTTLDEALKHLAERFDVRFEVNSAAFKEDQIVDPLGLPVAEKPIRPMKNIRLATALGKVLAQVPAASGTTFLVRPQAIEITTGQALAKEVWGGSFTGPFLPLVTAGFEQVTLDDAFKQLASQAEFSVILDARVAAKGKTAVSAQVLNTPLDTAVRLLADMAELKVFHLDNVLYVTSKESAAKLEAEERSRQESGAGSGPRQGTGRNGLPRQAGPAM